MIFGGKSVFAGVAIGKIAILKKEKQKITKEMVADIEKEQLRVDLARKKAIEQLKALYHKAADEVGEEGAMIFEVHQMMLEDLDYLEAIGEMIRNQHVNAEFAVMSTGEQFSAMFEQMDDEYMKARAADVKDISGRVISILQGQRETLLETSEATIVVAEDLAPSETVQLDKSKVLAFVTRYGSSNSHTAILARTMNIPALIGVEYEADIEGKMAIVDGFSGKLIVDPKEEIIESYRKRQQEELQKRALLQELMGKKNVTKSGKQIKIYANIGNVSDVDAVLSNDAGGIGLFRSEFLYLESKDYPSEEQQFTAYRKVAEAMEGKPVIIRTLDIGADKQADYFNLDKEENPAMGYRAIRICLTRPEIFRTQLRALLRASAYGTIAVMYPMIISLSEVRTIKALMEEVKQELRQEGIAFRDVEQGVMIETPAAAMISDLLAKEVDFFSIGTNDLTQYTLAIDRQNAKLDAFYDSHHEAVLRMIQMVVDNAHKEGIWAGICGELGADLTLTEEFVRMGVDELSVTPTFILPVRKVVREME